MENYLTQFIALANGVKLTVLLAFLVANFIIGLAASIYTGEFRLSAIADFMMKRVLPYVVAYIGIVIIVLVEPAWEVLVTIIWAILIAALIGHVAKNLKDMGIPLPNFIAGSKK